MVEFTYKNITYFTHFSNITQLKFMLNQDFKKTFFSKESKKSRGDISQKWFKKSQTLVITTKESICIYVLFMKDNEMILKLQDI